MPNPNYLKGRRAEWKVKKYLEAKFPTRALIIRSAGSRGPVDLVIAYKTGDCDLIQVKTGPRRPKPTDTGYKILIAWVKPGGEIEWL